MADAAVEEKQPETQEPVQEATANEGEAKGENESEKKPAEQAEEVKSPKKEAAEVKSPKKSPAKAKKEEPAAEEADIKSTTKKDRPKKEAKEESESEDDANVGQYWEVQEGQKRQRKSLEHFKVEVAKVKETEVRKGTGKALKDIPAVVELFGLHTIKKADTNDPLKNLSRLLFNKFGGSAREIKNNILEFNGFAFADTKAEENMKARISKKVMKDLKDIMGLLALDRSGSHGELAERLFKFLKKPTASECTARKPIGMGKKAKSSKKRTAKGSKKKAPAKKNAKKKEEEDSDEEESEEEEEEEEEAASPKKKAKPAAKPTVDEDSDLDVPLMPPKADPYLEKLKGHVQSVIKEQDMDLLTLRMVRETLASKFEVDVEKYKTNIREFVDEIVSAAST